MSSNVNDKALSQITTLKLVKVCEASTQAKVPVFGQSQQAYGFNPGLTCFFKCQPSQSERWNIEVFKPREQVFSPAPSAFNILFEQSAFNVLFEQSVATNCLIKSPQQATVVVKMDNSQDPQQFWQFNDKGVVYTQGIDALNCQVTTKLIDNKTTLVITITQVTPVELYGVNAFCIIPFRFAATSINLSSLAQGSTSLYYSQDPSIGVGGEIGN
jgi:hypothetical protein